MLSILEVCQMTGKSEKTIYRMMNSGALPFTNVGNKRYINKSDLAPHIPKRSSYSEDIDVSKKIDVLTAEVTRLSTLVEALIQHQHFYQSDNKSKNQKTVNDNQIQSNDKVAYRVSKHPPSSSNEMRAQKAKAQIFEALNELKISDSIPLYRGSPSITGIHRITGIDRGTISKYLKEWIDNNY